MITIISTRQRDNGTVHCEFTWTDGGGDIWPFCGVCPGDVDPVEYWNKDNILNTLTNIISNKFKQQGCKWHYKIPIDKDVIIADLSARLVKLENALNN